MPQKFYRPLILVSLLSFLASPGWSAIWGGPDSEGWDFVFTPYGYSSDLKADATVKGQTADFERFDPTDFVTYGSHVRTEFWKGRFGILANLNYLDMWDEDRINDATTAEFTGTYWGIESALSYRALQRDLKTSTKSDIGLDLFAGARMAFLNMDLGFSPGPVYSKNLDWVEPLVGGRFIYGVGTHWNFVLRGDVGGFGIGNGSDLTWSLTPEVMFLITEGIYINGGYEIFDLKTENVSGDSQNELHARTTGPTLGLTLQFSTE